MAAREDGGEDLLDDVGLADDGAFELIDDLIASLAELGEVLADFIFVGGHARPFVSWRAEPRERPVAGGVNRPLTRLGSPCHCTQPRRQIHGSTIRTWRRGNQPTSPVLRRIC